MQIRRGFIFSLLLGASALAGSGCAGHSGGFVPNARGSSGAPAAKALHPNATYQTIVRHAMVKSSLNAAPSDAFAPGYAGVVKTIGALLSYPSGLTYDADDGKIYVVDRNSVGQSEILRVYPSGATALFVTLSGNASQIVYDHATQSFYVTSGSGTVGGDMFPGIYQITSTGTVSILAGGKIFGVVDGTGSGAGMQDPTGITVDPSNGLLYFADEGVVRSLSTSGVVKTISGQILANGFNTAIGVAYNAKDGNLYVGNGGQNTILQVTTSGQSVTFAGTCLNGSYSCTGLERDGKGTSALFYNPYSLDVDPATGDIYVADAGNNAIRKIALSARVSVLAGSGLATEADGLGLSAAFNNPTQIAMANGKAYVLDTYGYNYRSMRSVTISGSTPPPPPSKIHFFQTPSLYPALQSIAGSAKSTYLWYAEGGVSGSSGKIGQLSTSGASVEYAVSGSPQTVAIGADNTPWFSTNSNPVSVGHLVNGQATEWVIPNASAPSGFSPANLTLGPDGNMWFTFGAGYGSVVFGNVTSSGVVTEYTLPAPGYQSPALAFTQDGNAWVSTGGTVLEVSTQGAVLNSFSTSQTYQPQALTQGPDGNLWFDAGLGTGAAVGTFRTNPNVMELFPILSNPPGCPSNCSRTMYGITTGPDANLWIAEWTSGFASLASMSTGGVFNEYVVPAAHSTPVSVAGGPDGNVWFVDSGAQKIGRYKLH